MRACEAVSSSGLGTCQPLSSATVVAPGISPPGASRSSSRYRAIRPRCSALMADRSLGHRRHRYGGRAEWTPQTYRAGAVRRRISFDGVHLDAMRPLDALGPLGKAGPDQSRKRSSIAGARVTPNWQAQKRLKALDNYLCTQSIAVASVLGAWTFAKLARKTRRLLRQASGGRKDAGGLERRPTPLSERHHPVDWQGVLLRFRLRQTQRTRRIRTRATKPRPSP